MEKQELEAQEVKTNQQAKLGFFQTAKDSVGEFLEDECLNLAGGIAYFTLQSLIPLILGFIAVGSFFLRDNSIKQQLIDGVSTVIPAQVSASINLSELLTNLSQGAAVAGVFSVLVLLWTGSSIFDQLIYATNKAFDVEKDERNFFVKLGLRLAMTLGIGVLLAAAVIISVLSRLVFDAKVSIFGISPANFSFILPILAYLIPITLQAVTFAIIYRFAPARKGLRWKPILAGALVASVLFELLKFGFSLYVTNFGGADGATKTYGALGGIIVFLLFLYLTAAVVLFGAEVAATAHNFKSGLAAIKTSEAVVEAPEKEQNGILVPTETAKAESGVIASPAPLAAPVTDRPESKLKLILGTIFLLVVSAASLVYKKKNNLKI